MVRGMMNPTLDALRSLGGSASIRELDQAVVNRMGFPEHIVQHPHGKGNRTEVEWRLVWVRTYLGGVGLLTNSSRGVWALTPEGLNAVNIDPQAVIRNYSRRGREADDELAVPPEEESGWREQLIEILLSMEPSSFERLCQRLLRESGFIEVQVTGRSGDGGIDGRGIIRFAGLIGFPVLFQCKRFTGSVTAPQIRDFRGAMTGRSDRGLFITTGSFTQEAQREATRDGAPPIDLISGEILVDKLKELELGVVTQQVELVTVEPGFFTSF